MYQGGHLGRDKTYEKVASRFYWSSVNEDVKLHIRYCDVCQRTNDAKFFKSSATLHPIPVKPKVWNQVCVCVYMYVIGSGRGGWRGAGGAWAPQ